MKCNIIAMSVRESLSNWKCYKPVLRKILSIHSIIYYFHQINRFVLKFS